MQSRFHNAALVLSVAGPLLLAAAISAEDLAQGSVRAGDVSSSSDEVDMEVLDELIRQAKELRAAREKRASEKNAPAAAPAPLGSAEPAGQAAESAQSASEGEAPEAEDSAAGPVEQAGCMYRDDRLIWERVPGTCTP